LRWRRANPDKNREYKRRYHYKFEYGIDFETLEKLKAEQKTCAICGEVPERWHVDHNHETGRFRGLLCDKCNKALGMLGDTVESLQRAVEYLKGKTA